MLYQDPDILLIDKPAGIPSQATLDPKRPYLSALLQKQLGRKVFLQHRLDKDTSGVMLFGLSKRVNSGLTELFREHQVEKIYLCISKIHKPLMVDTFSVQNFLAPVRNQGRQLMRMVSVKKGGWEAQTFFTVLGKTSDYAFIQAKPKTGRTHQIRIHLAELKLPILGDPLYGGKSSLVPRLMLHAQSLEFTHPLSRQKIKINCEPPADFKKILAKIQLSAES